jgi:hypothetical protein
MAVLIELNTRAQLFFEGSKIPSRFSLFLCGRWWEGQAYRGGIVRVRVSAITNMAYVPDQSVDELISEAKRASSRLIK